MPSKDITKKYLCILGDITIGVNQYLEKSIMNFALNMIKENIGFIHRGVNNELINVIVKEIVNHRGNSAGFVNNVQNNGQVLNNIHNRFTGYELHENKMNLFENSDGFVVLPGGTPTLEILMEYLTWMQRVHKPKPVYIVNHSNYWHLLIQMFDSMHNETFLPADFYSRYILVDDMDDIIPHFKTYK